MARPKQDGLKYFPFDTDFFYTDKRIKRLHARYGNDGVLFYVYLLTEIYRNGYYARWDEDSVCDAMALNLTEGFIEQVMLFFNARELIVKIDLKASNGTDAVITSPGIQKRYQEAVKSLRRDVHVDAEIWLLKEEETAACIKVTHNEQTSGENSIKSGENTGESGKNDTNKIKVNKKKQNEMKRKDITEKEVEEKETKKAVSDTSGKTVYYPDELLNQAFLDFMEMRKKIRKPMTDRAVGLAMGKLKELSSGSGSMDNDLAIRILDQSTMNCWQGLFPLKVNGSGRGNDYDEWRHA